MTAPTNPINDEQNHLEMVEGVYVRRSTVYTERIGMFVYGASGVDTGWLEKRGTVGLSHEVM